jgi:hypothetical protein
MRHDSLIPFLLLVAGVFGAGLVIFLTYSGFALANLILRQL